MDTITNIKTTTYQTSEEKQGYTLTYKHTQPLDHLPDDWLKGTFIEGANKIVVTMPASFTIYEKQEKKQ